MLALTAKNGMQKRVTHFSVWLFWCWFILHKNCITVSVTLEYKSLGTLNFSESELHASDV